jgi:sulfur carrier protein ThiS
MRIYLGGHLDYYNPQQGSWMDIEQDQPIHLRELLDNIGIPLAEVQITVINGNVEELHESMVSNLDVVKLFSAVGGG